MIYRLPDGVSITLDSGTVLKGPATFEPTHNELERYGSFLKAAGVDWPSPSFTKADEERWKREQAGTDEQAPELGPVGPVGPVDDTEEDDGDASTS